MSAASFLSSIGEALLDAFDPLRNALSSPTQMKALLLREGWCAPDDDAYLEPLSKALALGGDVESVAATLAQVAGGDLSIDELRAALDTAAKLLRDLTAVTRPTGVVLPSPLDRDDFWSSFPPSVAQDLVMTYFEKAHPLLFAPLHLLGVLDEQMVIPAPDDHARLPYMQRRLRWERLTTMVSDPGSLMGDVYGWGGTFDHSKLLIRLETVIRALGLLASRQHPVGELARRYYPGDPPSDLRLLRVTLLRERRKGGGVEIGLAAMPIGPTTGAPPNGLFIGPTLEGAADTQIAIDGAFSIRLAGGLESAGLVGIEIRPGRATPRLDAAAATIDLAITLIAKPAEPWLLVGSYETDCVECTELELGIELVGPVDDPELKLRLHSDGVQLSFDPSDSDSFVTELCGTEPKAAKVAGDLIWSSKTGLHFEGQADLNLVLPLHANLGPVTLQQIRIAIDGSGNDVTLVAAVSLGASIGPVQISLSDIGVKGTLKPVTAPARGTFGDLDLDFGFKPPSGVGLAIDVAGIGGGGFLEHDDAKQEYAGVLQLEFHTYKLTAFGLLATILPTGPGYSLIAIVDAEFPPIQLGFGFALDGAGGLLGVHRTASIDALRAALTAHTLSNLLFPKNPIANAPQLLTELDTLFPAAAGRFVFGPIVRIEWCTPPLLTLDLALVLELPDPVRLVLIAELTVLLPTPDEKLVEIHMSSLGTIDFGTCEGALDAVLHDSRLMKFVLHGSMALRVNWSGQKTCLLAVGGVHPKFQLPPGFPKLDRVGISMPSGHITKLNLDGYLAVTSNTLQIGAHLDILVGVDGFGISGYLSFDTLIQRHPFHFDGDISGGVALSVDGHDVMALRLTGSLTGPAPWNAAGSVSFDVMWWTVTKSFSETFGDSADAPPLDQVDVGQLLRTALSDARNFAALFAPDVPALVTLRAPVVAATVVLAHPGASLSVHQTVVPLGLTIAQYGGSAPLGETRFDITSVSADGVAQPQPLTPVLDDFAPAQFLTLSDDDKLASPSFERLAAGVELDGTTIFGAPMTRTVAYETFFIDTPDGQPREDTGVPTPFPLGVLNGVLLDGSAGRSSLTRAASKRYAGPRHVVMPAELDFVVATSDQLTASGVGASAGMSYRQARAALDAELALHPERSGELLVTARYEVAA